MKSLWRIDTLLETVQCAERVDDIAPVGEWLTPAIGGGYYRYETSEERAREVLDIQLSAGLKNGFYFRVLENGDHDFAERTDGGWELLGCEVWETDEDMKDCKQLIFIGAIVDEKGKLFTVKH